MTEDRKIALLRLQVAKLEQKLKINIIWELYLGR